MTRSLSSENIAASVAGVVRPVYLFELHYDSGISRFTSWTKEITFDGNTYLGVGSMVTLEDIQETDNIGSNGIRGVLSGVNAEGVGIALNEEYQGRPAYVYLGFLNESENLVNDPCLVFSGRMDTQKIIMGEEGKIELTVENRLVDWDRPKVYRLNNETMQSLNPGDKGAEFVEQAAEKAIYWGVNRKS